ncbi:MAG: aminotransferase class I/II-fold pyridoxal phosphate-dependent enzyme [Ignavibacteriales bacterium]|nr:aminotransferase class I/II-fold pyridoxal phosphate-dependent enzyme [Ignavibacteriales bacterium]
MSASIIDLRSDTITKPTEAMRHAMALAPVGDDVFAEDPTVNLLQQKVAALLGKPAALYVPSGVMSNQLALNAHTQPGDEVIVEKESHIFNYETAAPSILSNVQLYLITGERGILKVDQLPPAVRSDAYYMPRTRLICLENTHNRAGGTIYPIEEIRKIRDFAKSRGIRMHLDGARLWNASMATGISPLEYAQYFDTVSVCFSKGLGAPVGSALVGSDEVIQRARRFRKILGGGMRQAGIIAAGALYALEHHIDRLKEDHEKARLFAERIAVNPLLGIDLKYVQTNIVVFDVSATGKTTGEILDALRAKNVLLTDANYTSLRAVTHLDVTADQVMHAADIVAGIARS